ncbi:hypothetical protein C8R46DRAFT_1116869 [Mycena filopes]|nr:hypothetical protein C8R46DRAFT_1116869 [Mycena filopes]
MCPFCGNLAHPPAEMDTRPMSELLLTEAEYAEYKSHYASDTLYKEVKGNRKLRVTGFNEDTKAVFRSRNAKERDYIVVPWSDMDSVKWIAQRLEDKIRVSMHHWYLATADGVIFRTFGELVCSTAAFRVKGTVVLTLLMPTDLAAFTATHLKQHKWKQTTPVPCTSSDELENCVAEFHMINPKPSTAWAVYRAQRKAADEHVEEVLQEFAGEDRPEIYEKIEDAVGDVLASTDLDDELDSIHDCIVPLSVGLQDDGWGNVSSAEVFSRIYSPTNPAAVDVYLEYHYRTRYESVEFYCNIYYRVDATVADAEVNFTTPDGPRRMHGFHSLLEMGLADMPPGRRWRAIDERTFHISKSKAQTLHSMLFGDMSDVNSDEDATSDSEHNSESQPTALADKISVREMLRLLLASVGISFSVASDPDDSDDEDEYTMGDLRWEGLEGSEQWLGSKIRAVAGCAPMSRDGEVSDGGNRVDDDEDDSDDSEKDEDDEFDSEDEEGHADNRCLHQ